MRSIVEKSERGSILSLVCIRICSFTVIKFITPATNTNAMSDPANAKRGQPVLIDNEKDNDEKIVDLFGQMQNLVNVLKALNHKSNRFFL